MAAFPRAPPVPVSTLIAGEALPLDVSATATGGSVAPDFSTTPVTIVLDGPPAESGDTPPRFTFRWRPAGTSDDEFDLDGSTLTFDLASEWTAENLTVAGRWTLYLLVGAAATVQDAVGSLELAVKVPEAGALPVEDPP